ncbi:MAG: TIGR01212 family radical SAM protein, partial [Schaedlerella sp.]
MTDSHQKQVRWGEKRYHSMDYDLKQTYGEKVYKITLNGGMTCPNRDGTVGRGGCIFCSASGSGDCAGRRLR